MWDNMGIADKVSIGHGRWNIAAADMQGNGDIVDVDTVKWIRRQMRRRGTGDRRDAGPPDIAVFVGQ